MVPAVLIYPGFWRVGHREPGPGDMAVLGSERGFPE